MQVAVCCPHWNRHLLWTWICLPGTWCFPQSHHPRIYRDLTHYCDLLHGAASDHGTHLTATEVWHGVVLKEATGLPMLPTPLKQLADGMERWPSQDAFSYMPPSWHYLADWAGSPESCVCALTQCSASSVFLPQSGFPGPGFQGGNGNGPAHNSRNPDQQNVCFLFRPS